VFFSLREEDELLLKSDGEQLGVDSEEKSQLVLWRKRGEEDVSDQGGLMKEGGRR